MPKLLLVEDDTSLQATVKRWLEFEHYTVETAQNGTDATELLRYYKYDLIVLDLALPGASGLDVLREFRSAGGMTPILILTGKGTTTDKETGLDAGADDYLTKPFDLKELSARVRALLRRPPVTTGSVLKAGDITLDPQTHKVTRSDEDIALSQQEFALLEFLIRNQSQVFSPEALLDRVWKSDSDVSPSTIRTHIKTLRKKLDVEGKPSYIRNIHGVGYRFDA